MNNNAYKFIQLLLSIILYTFILSNSIHARVVKVGVYQNNPKVFITEEGKPSGIFVDIIEDISKNEKWDLQYVQATWAECLQNLDSGNIDIMVDVGVSLEREKKYDFCSSDVITNWAQVYSNERKEITVITDLQNCKIAALKNDIHKDNLTRILDGFELDYELVEVESYEDVLRQVHLNTVDVGVVNRIFGYAHDKDFTITKTPVVFSPVSLRFAVKKDTNRDVLLALNARLKFLKEKKGSIYYQSLRYWLGETSEFHLPKWIMRSIATISIFALFIVLLCVLLKYQINKKTETLRLANKELSHQIDETMKAHLELKKSENLLVKKERLSALGQITNGIAHDFNNMLIPILGYSDIILQNDTIVSDKPEKVLNMISTIHDSAITARDLVKRLQEHQKADPRPEKINVDIKELIDEVILAAKPMWKSELQLKSMNIDVKSDVQDTINVVVSKTQIKEALLNLLINAVHASKDNGYVIFHSFINNDDIVIEVEDSGKGMSKEVIDRCMEPFYSTKGENGNGMGLSMVHGIVKRHNGTININSKKGIGTIITITIPMDQGVSEPLEAQIEDKIIAPKTILIVEDDRAAQELLTDYLQLDNHTVITAHDYYSGGDMMKQHPIELVITDRAMDGKSGDEFANFVKFVDKSIPIIMATGFAEIMRIQGDIPHNIDYLLGKPYTISELRKALMVVNSLL